MNPETPTMDFAASVLTIDNDSQHVTDLDRLDRARAKASGYVIPGLSINFGFAVTVVEGRTHMRLICLKDTRRGTLMAQAMARTVVATW